MNSGVKVGMVHEELLNAYIFDFLKKKGFLQTALLFADECKDLPLAEITSNDPLVSMPPGLGIKGDAIPATATAATSAPLASGPLGHGAASKPGSKNSSTAGLDTKGSLSPASTLPTSASTAPASATDRAGGAESRSVTASPQTQHRVPSVNIPINTPRGFLAEWWSIFWDVFAATSDRRPAGPIADNIRDYVLYQNQKGARRPSNIDTLNINGKRFQPQDPLPGGDSRDASVGMEIDDGIQGVKKTRVNVGDRSPQSAALVAKYSFADDVEGMGPSSTVRQSSSQATILLDGQGNNGLSTNGIPAIPRGPGVNISLAGAHVLSEDYTGFLSRSLKVVAENHVPASSSTFTGNSAASTANTAGGAQPSGSSTTAQGSKTVATEGGSLSGTGSNPQTLRQKQDNHRPNPSPPEPNATGAQSKINNSSESPLSHGANNSLGQNSTNKPNSTFASPHINNASVPRAVPTQQHAGMQNQQHQQLINSPLANSTMMPTAAMTASNIQMIQRLMSPPPPPMSYSAYSKQPPVAGSPVVSNASAAHPDLRRASTASVLQRATQQTQQHPQQQQQQQFHQQHQINPSPLVNAGGLQRVGSTGPQPGVLQRQQQIPSNLGAGIISQGMPVSGLNAAELGFSSNASAMAMAAAAAAAAAAGHGGLNGRNPTQAMMMAYFQQQQQQNQQQGKPSVPSNDSMAGNRQPPQPQHPQQQQQQMNMHLHASQLGHQFIPVGGMAMSAAEQNANVPGMMQDQQNQRYMLQLQMQMQQNANPQNMHHPPSSVGGSGSAAIGHGHMSSSAQRSEDVGTGGLSENVSAAATGQMSAVSARKSVGNVGSPQLVPQQGSPVGGASTGSKKTAAKPKAKRNSKKSAKNALPSTSTSAAATNAMARSHSMSGNIDGGAMTAHPRGGISGVPVNPAALGNVGGGQPATSNSSSSAGSSIVSSSPALAIKATSTSSAGGMGNMPVANNVTVAPSAGLGSTGTSPSFSASTGALSIGISGQTEPDGRPPGGGGSMAGFGDNTFSALLSQKGNRVAMQSTHSGGGNSVGGGAVASDLVSAMNALGGVGGIDANELSLHLSEWLNDSSADALNNILSMGATMGAGDVGGDQGNGGVLGNDAVSAAAVFSSFMASNGGGGGGSGSGNVVGGAGGFPGALGMPSMGGGSGIGASNNSSIGGVSGGIAVPIPGVGGGGAGKIGEANNVVNMVFSPPAAPGNKSM
ncbi:hypothetical protein IWW48_003815 [Coemansia sp. RSA 1200]|nr:hypothetical protein IWW48_003815 [Coemansia sp. RSA 1200]